MNKKIISILMLVLLVTGCSSGKSSNVVCKRSERMFGFDVDFDVNLKATGDDLDKYTSTTTYKVSSVLTEANNYEYYEKQITKMYDSTKKLKGVTTKVSKTKDNNIEVKVTVDYSKVDTKKLKNTGFIASDSSTSLKKIKADLKKNEYKCK